MKLKDCKWTPGSSLPDTSVFLRQIKRNLRVCDDAMATKSYTKQHYPFVVASVVLHHGMIKKIDCLQKRLQMLLFLIC